MHCLALIYLITSRIYDISLALKPAIAPTEPATPITPSEPATPSEPETPSTPLELK